jgi:hypothetical protein
MTWTRATKSFRCAVCNHPDWCTYAVERQMWCCMRVESSRPAKNGGFWHSLGEKPTFIPRPAPAAPEINAAEMMDDFQSNTTPVMLARHAASLGVSTDSLTATGCAWAAPHGAWAWPMVSGVGKCVGIRLRAEDGRKWSVRGGHEGIFVPRGGSRTAYIVEGPTDTCAALTLGLWAIGRPSCRGSVAHTQVAINRLHIQRAILVSDNDGPGIDGAKALAGDLQIPVAAMLLPAKDLRQFLAYGGTRCLLDSLERQLVWRQPG